jgi:hypothetical protein
MKATSAPLAIQSASCSRSCGGGWRMNPCGFRPRCYKLHERRLGQRGRRTGPGMSWVGRPRPAGPGLFRPGSAPVSSPVASHAIPYLCALACGSLMSFPSRLRLESCYPSFSIFWLSPWRFAHCRFSPRVIWSHVHRVSWLLSGFMIFF